MDKFASNLWPVAARVFARVNTPVGSPFIFRCPTTWQNVQGISERDEQPSDGRRLYEGVLCLACQQVHIVNLATGRLMSEEIED